MGLVYFETATQVDVSECERKRAINANGPRYKIIQKQQQQQQRQQELSSFQCLSLVLWRTLRVR